MRNKLFPGRIAGGKLAALAVMAVLATAATQRAHATEITFDGLAAGGLGTTYVEKGYQFYNPNGDLFSWGVGGPNSFDHTPGSATIAQPYNFTTTTLTKVGGGAF